MSKSVFAPVSLKPDGTTRYIAVPEVLACTLRGRSLDSFHPCNRLYFRIQADKSYTYRRILGSSVVNR